LTFALNLFSGETLESDPLSWVWKIEIETHRRYLATARSQLEHLDRCIKGEKVMDSCSLQLSKQLKAGEVPDSWSGKKLKKTVKQYLEILRLRTEFYKVTFGWLEHFLDKIRFQFYYNIS
jgi:hypothetical protein